MNRWHENGSITRAVLALVLACGLLASWPGEAAAQTGVFQRVRIGGCLYSSGAADPEGAVIGNPCDVYTRTTGGTDTTVYRKETGVATNTGWKATTASSPAAATYITQTAHAGLSAEQAIGALSPSAILTFTTGTGVLAGYAGTSCTNQFVRSLSALGASTCATVSLTTDITGTLAAASGGTGQSTYTIGDVLYASTSSALSKLASGGAGTFLRFAGASTAPVVSTLVLPNAATANRVPYATSANTWGESANLNFDGAALMVGTNTANGASTGDIRANDAYYSHGRAAADGYFTTPTFSASNYSGSGSMTWTVAAGDVSSYAYALVGETMTFQFYIATSTVAGTLDSTLLMTVPASLTPQVNISLPFFYKESTAGNWIVGEVLVQSGNPILSLRKLDLSNWVATTDQAYVQGVVNLRVQ